MGFSKSFTLLAFILLTEASHADPLSVIDDEGFGAQMTAMTLDLPAGWTGSGKVIWNKPCSGNELYELSVMATSADGQSGIRMKPGHQLQWVDTTVDASVDPYLAQMALAQAASLKAQMKTQFQRSNCHFGRLDGPEAQVTQGLIRALILPDLPAGAQVTGMQPNPTMLASYKAAMLPAQAGFFSRYDAQIVDLAYAGSAGPMVERLWLTWSQFGSDPAAPGLPGFPRTDFQTLTLDTITFAFAPASRPQDIEAAAAAIQGAKVDARWSAELRKVQDKIAEERRKTQKDKSDAFDRQNKAFLDTIMQ